jgi:hypothetical protein
LTRTLARCSSANWAERWLASRIVETATEVSFEYIHRLHLAPACAKRQVKTIKPSHVQAWISDLSSPFGTSTVQTAFLVLRGVFSLAVADEVIKRSPAKSPVVQVPKRSAEEITARSDERVSAVIDAHPQLFGLALEYIDFEERVLRVRRQIKKPGSEHVHALP